MTDIIIGSGPTGISAAVGRLERGRKVTLLDGGKMLEPALRAQSDALAATQPHQWDARVASEYQQPQFETPQGQTRRFGSDFAMEPGDTSLTKSADWFSLRASHAAGGLSNLWGAAVLPYRQSDISAWPITIDDLTPHYSAVANFMPISARPDRLNPLFPGFHVATDTTIEPGVQTAALLENMERNRQDGVHFGAARTAVGSGCTACGMCLHGCPWGQIYSAQHTLDDLKSNPDFTYRLGALVTAFAETPNGVEIHLADGETITGDRLFIGAGVLETARIVLNSSPDKTQTMTLLDSQQALVPMLHRWSGRRRPDKMPLTTLPQIFVEMDVAEISPHLVHSQFYTWNEYYARDLATNYGLGLPIARTLFGPLARRMIIAQLFLHSDHSAKIDLTLDGAEKLKPQLRENAETSGVLKSAQSHLGQFTNKSGLTMLGFASRRGSPGSSFHTGGTVPMSGSPNTGQSDVLGRPHGLDRVHLVDSSVFPSIPATTITFSAMANAHRIASLAP